MCIRDRDVAEGGGFFVPRTESFPEPNDSGTDDNEDINTRGFLLTNKRETGDSNESTERNESLDRQSTNDDELEDDYDKFMGDLDMSDPE